MDVHEIQRWFVSHPSPPSRSTCILVLAGGEGTRLRASADPVLRSTPKLLVPINRSGRPTAMLGATLEDLRRAGCHRVALLTGSDAEAIEAHARAGYAGDLDLSIHREGRALGTAGAVYAALRHVCVETAAIIPGDTRFPFELLHEAITSHASRGAGLTWVVTTEPGPGAQNAGRLWIDPAGARLVHALEGADAAPADAPPTLCSATSVGVVIVERAYFLDRFEACLGGRAVPSPVDLYRDLVPWLLDRGDAIAVFDIRRPSPDLGTPERLAAFG